MLPPPLLLHQRQRAARERDQRIGADVERQLEAVARRLDERIREVLAGRVRGAVDEEVEAAERAVDLLEHARDLRVVGDVERKHQRIGEAFGEVAHVLFEPLALVRQRDARARGRGRLRDRPRDRPLVGDADDEAGLSCER